MLDWESEDTDSVQSVLESFSDVWERVTGTQERKPRELPRRAGSLGCEDRLRELSVRAAEAAMFDRALACRWRGTSRTALTEHTAQAARRAALLRGEYFVRTGVKLCAPESCPRLGEALAALREGMLRDEASAEAYRRLSEQTDDEELRAGLTRFSCETAAAAAEKRRIIFRCFA